MSMIYRILKSKSIVEYLEKKGHQPVKTMTGGRLLYLCPFPDHKEKKPSFVVWTQADYENFRCFGCQRNYNIINLVSELEGISYRESVQLLSDGMEIGIDEDIDFKVDMSQKMIHKPEHDLEFSQALFSLSSMCRSYLYGVDNDTEEMRIIDQFWEEVDRSLLECDFDNFDSMVYHLPKMLHLRQQRFEQNKIAKMRASYENS